MTKKEQEQAIDSIKKELLEGKNYEHFKQLFDSIEAKEKSIAKEYGSK